MGAANDPSTFFIKPRLPLIIAYFIESGNDKGNLALGYTRNNEKGVLPNSSINKDLLNLSASYKITDNLTAGGTANYSRIDGIGRFGTGYDGANALKSYDKLPTMVAGERRSEGIKGCIFQKQSKM